MALIARASVPLAATATSSAGISKVEFYNGTQLLSTSLTSPYSYNWTGVSTGNYALSAKAYDGNGLTGVSIYGRISVWAIFPPAVWCSG